MLPVRVPLLLVAVVVLAACGAADQDDVADATTLPPSTTTAAPNTTTTLPPVVAPELVSVPDLSGVTLGEAEAILADTGLDILALSHPIDSAIVFAQEPAPGVEVDEGSVVTVDLLITPTCNPPDPIAPDDGQTIISVFYECGGDVTVPTPGIGVPRIVPESDQAVDRIEWTLRALLAGPTLDERIAGFVSAFDAATANALNGVTLIDEHLVVDFNDAIIVNNMNTSTGMIFFQAELHRNVFQHPEVVSVEFRFNGDCGAWSGLFESDGCRVVTQADWKRHLTEWDQDGDQ
ncbi:MAG TPA: PASTA domain-containing protein [Acidimicrobiia bacterium]|jgi:hypothetical protein|nr:PASTA domain-containing protein [Acidimicrobiia bacterium]